MAEDRQTRGPALDLLQRAISHAGRIVVETYDERRDRVNVALGQAIEHGGILARFVKAFIHIGKVDWIDRLHAYEYPFAI